MEVTSELANELPNVSGGKDRRRRGTGPEATPTPAPTPAPRPSGEGGEEGEEGEGGEEGETRWDVGEWRGYERWACRLCPFDTLDGEGAMVAHWMACHAPPSPAPPSAVVQVYTAGGRPVRPQPRDHKQNGR